MSLTDEEPTEDQTIDVKITVVESVQGVLKRNEHSIPIIFAGIPQTSTFVADFSFLDKEIETEQNVKIEAEFEIERPTMTIDSIDNYGLMTVTFSKPFAIPEDYEASVA